MLGCKGPSRLWRGVLDRSLGHSLAHCIVEKGEQRLTLFFCTTCGAYSSARCHMLGKECTQRRLAGGATTLRRIVSGVYPHYRQSSTVGESSRRGVAFFCYASQRPPPRDVSLPGSSAGLIETPGMAALQARIQAREASAAARSAAAASRDAI